MDQRRFLAKIGVILGVVGLLACGTIGRVPPAARAGDREEPFEDSGLGPRRAAGPVWPLRWGDAHVRIEALPGQTALFEGAESELYLRIEINAADADGPSEDRLPLNLALVVDRSGSMEGEKLARAIETGTLIVDHLLAEDRLAVVSYADDVTVEVPSRDDLDRRRLKRVLHSLSAGGTTNLFGGLEEGVRQVRAHLGGGVNRVFLLSDGLANRGVVDERRMLELLDEPLEEGVTLTTFGIGLDFNEQLLGTLARQGRGHFYFVEEPEALVGAITDELRLVGSTVARQAELQIELSEGVRLEKVWGHRTEISTHEARIRLRDMAAGERRKILLKLRIASGASSERAVARLRFEYLGTDRRTHRLEAPAEARVRCSVRQEDVDRSVVDDVAAEVAYTETSSAFEEAAGLLRAGQRESARAILQQARDATQAACKRYSTEKLCKQVEHLKTRIVEMEGAETADDKSRVLKSSVHDIEMPAEN
jgi:Ca-activated chloride channel homolog